MDKIGLPTDYKNFDDLIIENKMELTLKVLKKDYNLLSKNFHNNMPLLL